MSLGILTLIKRRTRNDSGYGHSSDFFAFLEDYRQRPRGRLVLVRTLLLENPMNDTWGFLMRFTILAVAFTAKECELCGDFRPSDRVEIYYVFIEQIAL